MYRHLTVGGLSLVCFHVRAGIELRCYAVTENWCVRSNLNLAGFRDIFGSAGVAEARMSAALLGMGCTGA